MESVTIALKHPIVLGEEGGTTKQINSVTVGRLKVKHLKHIPSELLGEDGKTEKSPQQMLPQLIPMLASMCDLTEEQMDMMDVEDMAEVTEKAMDFLQRYLKIGEK